jgi:hypothetical protein
VLEKNLRKVVVRLLKHRHAISVENGMTHPGTPDVACALGWIELKATERWPVRPDSIVRLDHDMTPQQRIWHMRHRRAGGKSLVVVVVSGTWLVFDGQVAAEHLGNVHREALEAVALVKWDRTPKSEELERCFAMLR